MDTTKCISDLDWKAYAAGNLAAPEVAALHAHAASCEICGDILAGITAMDDAPNLGAKMESLYSQIDANVAKKMGVDSAGLEANDLMQKPVVQEEKQSKRFALYYPWVAAAAVLLIAGFGLLQFQKKFEGGDVAKVESGTNIAPQKLDQSANSDAQISVQKIEPLAAQDAQVIADEPQLNDEPSNHRSEVAVSTAQVESVQTQISANRAGEEDLGRTKPASSTESMVDMSTEGKSTVAVSTKALTTQDQVLANENKSKEDASKIASSSKVESEAAGADDQAVAQVQIATVSKSQNRLIQKRSKQIKSLPSNAAFNNTSEQEFHQNNNSNLPQTNPSHTQTQTDSTRTQTQTDSLFYQVAFRQYNTQQLDSALTTLKPILNNSQGLYYKEGLKLQRQIIDKKKSGK